MDEREKCFEQALALAAAFVANGDIRLAGGSPDPNQDSMAKLGDLIDSLFDLVAQQRARLLRDDHDG